MSEVNVAGPVAKIALRRAAKRAGLVDFTTHDHRHDVASRLTREAGIAVAQSQLGHADIATTKRYVKVSTRDRLEALSRIIHRETFGDGAEKVENTETNQRDTL